MARIRFSQPSAGANAYTVPINPIIANIPFVDKTGIIKVNQILDGEPVTIRQQFDHRVAKLGWKGFPSSHTAFATMVAQLKTYEWDPSLNNYCYIDLEDVGDAIGALNSWTKIKVLSVHQTLREEAGLKYNLTELVFIKAE